MDGGREEARAWYAMLRQGIDPQQELAAKQAARQAETERRQEDNFGYVATNPLNGV